MVAWVRPVAGICTSGGHATTANFSTHYTGARGGFAGFMVALIAALWAYDGWSDVTHTAGDIQNPQRILPLALIGGVGIAGVLYIMTNPAIQFVLPATPLPHAHPPSVDPALLNAAPLNASVVSLP